MLSVFLSGWLWSLKDKEAIEESKMDNRKKNVIILKAVVNLFCVELQSV